MGAGMADFVGNHFGIINCAYDPNSLNVDYHQSIAASIFYRDKDRFIQAARDNFKTWIPYYALEQWAEARKALQAQADQAGVRVVVPDQPNLLTCPP